MHDETVKALRVCEEGQHCDLCPKWTDKQNGGMNVCQTALLKEAADAIEELQKAVLRLEDESGILDELPMYQQPVGWIPVTERLPECDLGAEVGNIEWISCGMVHAGCFGRGGKYRDAYFRTWTDSGEGMDAKDADYWRAVTLPEPPKEE